MPIETIPEIPEALIKALEVIFKNQCPDVTMSDREVWVAVGKASVVRFLREEFTRQQETS